MENQHGYSCPQCHTSDQLRISVSQVVRLLPDGVESVGDTEWDDNSFAACDNCDWSGIVEELDQTERRCD